MSTDDSSSESEWKHEAVSELADHVRDRVDKAKEKTSNSAKSKALETAHSVIDKAEEKLKQKA
ncbi:hypothetical protein [Halospeciosus flavus]|uniref:Uncharacterized protein n=1 Tax=Halospeciosus flavus TaxID=3032283 RepID=A0ABD5Z3T3_9EURY|nr:hypothetical protein [Halospeciosus flavus]